MIITIYVEREKVLQKKRLSLQLCSNNILGSGEMGKEQITGLAFHLCTVLRTYIYTGSSVLFRTEISWPFHLKTRSVNMASVPPHSFCNNYSGLIKGD